MQAEVYQWMWTQLCFVTWHQLTDQLGASSNHIPGILHFSKQIDITSLLQLQRSIVILYRQLAAPN